MDNLEYRTCPLTVLSVQNKNRINQSWFPNTVRPGLEEDQLWLHIQIYIFYISEEFCAHFCTSPPPVTLS